MSAMPAPTNASANGARPELAPVNGNDVVVVATGGFVEPSDPVVVVVVEEITVDGEILMLVVVDFGVNSNVVSVVELVLELVLVLVLVLDDDVDVPVGTLVDDVDVLVDTDVEVDDDVDVDDDV